MEINKIYLGDCYEMIKQLPDKSVDLVYTDIPYLYEKAGGTKKSSLAKRINRNYNVDLKELKDGIDYNGLFSELVRVMKYIYIYMVFKRSNTRHFELVFQHKR